jgi:uncharacterized phage protein (TIGR02220 family)
MNGENYILIQGWMRTELDLKGNELLAYALVYGFCQAEGHSFHGSRSYIMEWLGVSSKDTVTRVMKSLVSKGLLIREEKNVRGVTFVEYTCAPRSENQTTHGLKISLPQSENQTTPRLKIRPNNTREINIGDKNPPISPHEQEDVDEIVSHLNEVTGKRFNPRKDSTRKPIAARLREGYSVSDCIAVIDCKVAQWSKDPRMRSYLRPETLFRESKFEAYLNESPVVDMADCPF